MKYLVGELGELTGIRPSTIRKWQERFGIFNPIKANNGYHYYSTDDYMILLNIRYLLKNGKKTNEIMNMGRIKLSQLKIRHDFSEEEREIIKHLQEGQFHKIEEKLEYNYRKHSFSTFLHQHIKKILYLVGEAWEKSQITIAEEHSFSKWLHAYLYGKCELKNIEKQPIWLVTVFPDDVHELGALLHYADLVHQNVPAKYVGCLPLEFIIEELRDNSYRTVSLSMTLKQKVNKINKIKEKILKHTTVKKVLFGGRGYRLSINQKGD